MPILTGELQCMSPKTHRDRFLARNFVCTVLQANVFAMRQALVEAFMFVYGLLGWLPVSSASQCYCSTHLVSY